MENSNYLVVDQMGNLINYFTNESYSGVLKTPIIVTDFIEIPNQLLFF